MNHRRACRVEIVEAAGRAKSPPVTAQREIRPGAASGELGQGPVSSLSLALAHS